jgi:hypothetical protein
MLDKTTRVVRQINDEDAHKRYEKSVKLHKALLKKRLINLLKPLDQDLADRGGGVDLLKRLCQTNANQFQWSAKRWNCAAP